jgi:hypothetical protein
MLYLKVQEMKFDFNKCTNSKSIQQEDISNILLEKLYILKNTIGGKEYTYCFDIDELFQWILIKRINPYTNELLTPNQVKDILDEYYRRHFVYGIRDQVQKSAKKNLIKSGGKIKKRAKSKRKI